MKNIFTKKTVAIFLVFSLFCVFAFAPVVRAETVVETITNVVGGISVKPVYGTVTVLLYIINAVVSGITLVAGLLFDVAVSFSIIHIKEFFDNAGIVNTLWSFIRDLANISFIFMLLYLAITKILGSWGVKQQTTVMNVILAAIFVNFSMMLAKLLIDAGNVVAVELYKNIVGNKLTSSISNLFMQNLGLSTFLTDWKLTDQLATIYKLVCSIVACGWLVYLFIYCAVLFIGRAVMLLFLVISSPIAFMGKTVPFLNDLSDTWWKTLIDQILLAPLVMFLLYITLQVTQRIDVSKFSNNNDPSNSNQLVANFGTYFAFILIIVLLNQTIKIAKRYSGEVGKMVVSVAKGAAVAVAVTAAAAVTGGASLVAGASALGAGGAEAAAGKTGLSALGARLQFAGKKIADSKIVSTAGRFASGDLGEQPGVVGWAARKTRTGLFNQVKNATGYDIAKFEAGMKEQKRINETKILAGVQKKVTTVQTIGSDIKGEAKTQTEREQGVKKESLIADYAIKEKTFKAEQEKAKNNGTDIFKEPSQEYAKAESDFNAVDQKLKEFKGKENKLVVDLAQKRKAEWQNLIGDILEKDEKTGEMSLKDDKEIADTIREKEAQIIEGYDINNKGIKGAVKEWFKRGFSNNLWSRKSGDNVTAKIRKGLAGEKSVKEIIEDALKKENEKKAGLKTPEPASENSANEKGKV